jgi:hypothetical protein
MTTPAGLSPNSLPTPLPDTNFVLSLNKPIKTIDECKAFGLSKDHTVRLIGLFTKSNFGALDQTTILHLVDERYGTSFRKLVRAAEYTRVRDISV